MSAVGVVATVVYIALNIFFVFMWARFVLDLARTFARQWRPRGAGLVIAETVFYVTDPPITFVRRFVRPLRVGGVVLDLAWSIVMLGCIILTWVVASFIN
jgi:YggT family protein